MKLRLPGNRQDLKRSGILLFALLAITLTMRWAFARGKAERLFDLPPSSDFRLVGVRGDNVILMSSATDKPVQLRARSLNSATTRTLVEDEGLRNGYSLVLTDEALYYKTAPAGEIPPGGVMGGPQRMGASPVQTPGMPQAPLPAKSPDAVTPMPTISANANASIPRPRGPGQGQAVYRAPWPMEGVGDPPTGPNGTRVRPSKTQLWRVPLAGGEKAEIKVPLPRNAYGQRDYTVVKDTVYLTRFTPAPPARPAAPLEKRKECYVQLLTTPLTGGEPIVVQQVPGILSMLYGSRGRVYLIVARPDTPSKVDLYHMDAGGSRLQVVRDYQSWFPPVAAGGRLVWITRHFLRANPKAAGVSLDSSNLVSADFDGGDRHIVERLVESSQTLKYIGRPFAYNERVYVQVSERNGEPDGMNRNEVLFRIPATMEGLERVASLPRHASERGGFVESGWFYFGVNDRRQGIFDYLRDGDKLEFVEVLHRLKVPEK